MPKLSNVSFDGKSGKKYNFYAYSLNADFKDNISAVYVVTNRYENDKNEFYHKIIYIGQTEDLKERHSSHHKAGCFSKYDANCLCVMEVKSEVERLKIERDLIEEKNPPCNSL